MLEQMLLLTVLFHGGVQSQRPEVEQCVHTFKLTPSKWVYLYKQ